MKLQTSITPRRDGTVKVAGVDGVEYVFSAQSNGDLLCDVGDAAAIDLLQRQGDHFWPADDEAIERAEALLAQDLGAGGDPDDEVIDPDDETSDPNALPVEANTPPVTAPGKGRKAKG